MANECCETCRFWFVPMESKGTGIGWCRRSPPVGRSPESVLYALREIHFVMTKCVKGAKEGRDLSLFDPEASATYVIGDCNNFPYVEAEQWCGEYQAEGVAAGVVSE